MIGLPLEELDEGVLPPEDLDELLFEGMMVAAKIVRVSVIVLSFGYGIGMIRAVMQVVAVAE